MPRYIDADYLIKQIRVNEILPHDARKTLEAFLRMNEDAFIADVRENVHGHWDEDFYRCSICGYASTHNYVETQLDDYLSDTNDRLVAIQYRPMQYSDECPKLLAVFERLEGDEERST